MMKWLSRSRIPAMVLALLSWPAVLTAQHSALDLDGHAVDPLANDAGKIVVLVFVRRDCPLSGRYAPVVEELSRKYSPLARFWLVYPDKNEPAGEIRKSLVEYGYRLPALRDPEHALVKLAHVQITPEVAVFDRHRRLLYDGRIDDWYVSVTRARPAPTTHELEDAIRAADAGQAMAHPEVRAVGCYISDLE
jgi:hypothetical protein